MLFTQWPSVSEFEARSGWHVESQGLCQGDVCVAFTGATDEVRSLAAALGMPVLEEGGMLAIGPRAADHVLQSVDAPPLTLADVRTGQDFELASLKGTKVLLLAWASW
jgi:hypothetical protein